MSRFVIVSLLPPPTDQALRSWYQSLTQKPIPIQSLHLTLVPTFFINTNEALNQINTLLNQTTHNTQHTTAFSFSPPALFAGPDEKLILHLPIIPEKPLFELSNHLIHQLSDYLTFDLSIYKDQKLPPYIPHISLDYNLPPNLQSKVQSTPPPNLSFSLPPPIILQEQPDLSWKII